MVNGSNDFYSGGPMAILEMVSESMVNELVGIYKDGILLEDGSPEQDASAKKFSDTLESMSRVVADNVIIELVGIVVAMDTELDELRKTDGDVR